MKPAKTTSVEQLQLISRFESVRRLLLSAQYAQHLEKPLAYWALPTDRRMPLALLGRTLSDLLNTPFSDLIATPGIGQKKIRSFIALLARVANSDPTELPIELAPLRENGKTAISAGLPSNGFDPAGVSEVVWSQWRACVIRHGLGKEVLGRFAPSLQNMTRVIWNSPLESYTGLSLSEIRSMKTHGEKRVQAILEVFHGVHTLMSCVGRMDHLTVRILPRRIDKVDTWTNRMLQTPGIPSNQDLYDHFVAPLVEQVRVDATHQVSSLAENRLGILGPITSVRQAARTMGLTRARVYQLLNEINDIMSVRWPMGRHLVYELRDKFELEAAEMVRAPDLSQFLAAVELFYPGSRRGAAGPLEFVRDASDDREEEDGVAWPAETEAVASV
ncbi:MAG: hypothetical protein GXY83_27180 [Rhodopirellula sp.]|nr:hypothetical protein [Rhodopirellula sp.]